MMLIRVMTVVLILLAPQSLQALPFAQGRGSAGYAYLQGDKAVSTSIVSGAGRFGYGFDDSNYFVAIDVTAYRIHQSGPLGSENDGNSALFVFGHDWDSVTLWLGGGAGELRSFDRPTEKTHPYRYYVTDAQLGLNFALYRSDSARVELGTTLGRLAPDSEWRARYGLETINSLQIDIGFKLLNW